MFVVAFAIGVAPLFLLNLVYLASPRVAALMSEPDALARSRWILGAFFLTIPFTTAYAVLVDRLFDVQAVLRSALQYALTRFSIVVLSLTPFAALLVFLYRSRSSTLDQILGGPLFFVLVVLTVLGLVALRLRSRWLTALDRRYFRESYDTQAVLARLNSTAREASETEELTTEVEEQLDGSLHPESVEVVVLQSPQLPSSDDDDETRYLPVDS